MKTFTNSSQLLIILFMALLTYADHSDGNSSQSSHSDEKDDHNTDDQPDQYQKCEKLCNRTHPCPPECVNLLDPWSFDAIPTSLKKRSTEIDSLSFDDYLLLRMLRRDMKQNRLS